MESLPALQGNNDSFVQLAAGVQHCRIETELILGITLVVQVKACGWSRVRLWKGGWFPASPLAPIFTTYNSI